MSSVEIVDVQLFTQAAGPIRAFALDAPRAGAVTADGFELRGWVFGHRIPIRAVEVTDNARVIAWLPVEQRRDDVAADYPDEQPAGQSGFQGWVSAVGLNPEFCLQASAVLIDDQRHPLAVIFGRRWATSERASVVPARGTAASPGGMPDFAIIGAQRGGTAALYRYLTANRRIVAAATPDVHFFSLFFDRGLAWYRAQFPMERPAGILTGESSPYYLFHPLAAQRMRACIPETKVIVLLRDPVARAYSHYHLELGRGDETLSFEEAIACEEERLRGERERLLADDTYVSFAHQHHSYLARSRYVDQLRPWLERFPREQVLIIESEALFRDPPAVVRRTTDFLGLPPVELIDRRAYNEAPYPPMRAETRERLRDEFAEKNAELAALVGQDFGWTGQAPAVGDRPEGSPGDREHRP